MKYGIMILIFFLFNCVSYPNREDEKPPVKKNIFENYVKDRIMDLRDIIIITGSVGFMGGVKAQVGPVGLGLYAEDGGGIGHSGIPLAAESGIRNGEVGSHKTRELIFVINKTSSNPSDSDKDMRSQKRCKSYENSLDNPSSYTRLGIGLGFIIGAKLEVNPGELLDFLLGFFLLDIYKDDIYLEGKKKCADNR
ncbi:MAG: hypothetical protein KBA66_09325 [Leptospiraceae bacterium]|nr:hypothetical protein [Leptospiraceae bacterium]